MFCILCSGFPENTTSLVFLCHSKTKVEKKYGKKGHLHSSTEYSAVKYAEKPKKKNLQKGRSREGRAREGNPQGGENAGFCRI